MSYPVLDPCFQEGVILRLIYTQTCPAIGAFTAPFESIREDRDKDHRKPRRYRVEYKMERKTARRTCDLFLSPSFMMRKMLVAYDYYHISSSDLSTALFESISLRSLENAFLVKNVSLMSVIPPSLSIALKTGLT